MNIDNIEAVSFTSFEDLEPGDIIFTRDTSLISQAIRKVKGGNYSHCVVYLGDGLILESGWVGVVITGLKRYMNSSTVCTAAKLPSFINREAFISELKLTLGDNYDWKLFIGHALSTMFRFLKLKLDGFDTPSRWLCYEVIGRTLADKGLAFHVPVRDLNPQTLLDRLSLEGVKIWTL